jgi:hypothetical protein
MGGALNDKFSVWCRHLVDEYPADPQLRDLVQRAQCAVEGRHDLIHAIWGRHPDGYLGRWRRKSNLGIELGPLQDLLRTIQDLRDKINAHTLGMKTVPTEKIPVAAENLIQSDGDA